MALLTALAMCAMHSARSVWPFVSDFVKLKTDPDEDD